jgi:ubiquinone/menaquinone biosynthesis C-methylase UbiE
MAGTVVPWVTEGRELGEDVLEIGPGPGATTEALRHRAPHLTAVEIDPALARALTDRLRDGGVTIVRGDGRALPFADRSFDAVVCFTMLHHLPSAGAQDRLLAEALRVLRPGGAFAGSDSLDSLGLRIFHAFDTFVPVDPGTLAGRLAVAGFAEVTIEKRHRHRAFRFSARRPPPV